MATTSHLWVWFLTISLLHILVYNLVIASVTLNDRLLQRPRVTTTSIYMHRHYNVPTILSVTGALQISQRRRRGWRNNHSSAVALTHTQHHIHLHSLEMQISTLPMLPWERHPYFYLSYCNIKQSIQTHIEFGHFKWLLKAFLFGETVAH